MEAGAAKAQAAAGEKITKADWVAADQRAMQQLTDRLESEERKARRRHQQNEAAMADARAPPRCKQCRAPPNGFVHPTHVAVASPGRQAASAEAATLLPAATVLLVPGAFGLVLAACISVLYSTCAVTHCISATHFCPSLSLSEHQLYLLL